MTTNIQTSGQNASHWFGLAAFISGMCLSAAVALTVMMTLGTTDVNFGLISAVAVMGAGSVGTLITVSRVGHRATVTAMAILGAVSPFLLAHSIP